MDDEGSTGVMDTGEEETVSVSESEFGLALVGEINFSKLRKVVRAIGKLR